MLVEFTKPTMNFAVGDVVKLDARQKKLVDEYIEEYVEGNEDDRNRYKEVKAAVQKQPTKAELLAEAKELGLKDLTDKNTVAEITEAVNKAKQ